MLFSTLIQNSFDVPERWAELEITGLTADSREVKPGFLFAALPGTATDGAKFVGQALDKGAVAVLAPRSVKVDAGDRAVLVAVDNPRKELAECAARFYGAQPEIAVAVTGTNGKTSVVSFVRQIWDALGHRAASVGTIGVVTPDAETPLIHTTPDPVALHAMLRRLARDKIEHVALEVSSHGLAQFRADGVRFAAAGFTNISRDHLDYHATFDDYFAQKLRLFSELLTPGSSAVLNADSPDVARVRDVCEARGITVISVGTKGETIRLTAHKRAGLGHSIRVAHDGSEYRADVPLVGDFQVSNALVAAGLVMATGSEPAQAFRALENLKGAKGRLDLVGRTDEEASVFVDYAHTPDALENALAALRPYVEGRLVVVFGCGGDRDKGKRPQMGAAAAGLADIAYVTDDNPRTEDPAAIRREALAGCPDGIEIGDRAEAIEAAIAGLNRGDILLVAGKGHESGQTVGTEVLPFSDHDVVKDVLGQGGSE